MVSQKSGLSVYSTMDWELFARSTKTSSDRPESQKNNNYLIFHNILSTMGSLAVFVQSSFATRIERRQLT